MVLPGSEARAPTLHGTNPAISYAMPEWWYATCSTERAYGGSECRAMCGTEIAYGAAGDRDESGRELHRIAQLGFCWYNSTRKPRTYTLIQHDLAEPHTNTTSRCDYLKYSLIQPDCATRGYAYGGQGGAAGTAHRQAVPPGTVLRIVGGTVEVLQIVDGERDVTQSGRGT
eukprot:2920849-Rhodomonas_salina.1